MSFYTSGRRGAKLAEHEGDFSPENPRSGSPPPSLRRVNPRSGSSPPSLRRVNPRSGPRHRKKPGLKRPPTPYVGLRRHNRHRPRGAKLASDDDMSPEKPMPLTPQPPPRVKTLDLSPPASPPPLPVPASPAPDRSDPTLYRVLPTYFYHYRILPAWANVGVGEKAAGSPKAAPAKDSS